MDLHAGATARARARFLHLPSALILSILIFTSSISAQSTISSISAAPTTFETSASSVSSQFSTPPSSSSTPPPTSTSTSNLPTNSSINNSNPDNDNDRVQRSVFNYYFLIIAAVLILLGAAVLFLRSRKRRKAAFYRSNSQRALARDVEGFRGRFNFGGGTGAFGIGGAAYRASTRTRTRTRTRGDTEEGLDERGEAPPPYVEGTKPPSIRETHSDGLPEGAAVELQDMQRSAVNQPPSYDEHSRDGQAGLPTSGVSDPESLPVETGIHDDRRATVGPGSMELTRPLPAVTAPERIT